MSAIRALPPRPSLEFERKEAKALLRRLRAGDAQALLRAHARHPAMQVPARRIPQLADAQLVIAREYGFASWPRLVRYFEDAERVLHRTPSARNPGPTRPAALPGYAQHLIEQHKRRVHSAARALIAYVPRFYGLSMAEAFELDVAEHEARLAVARQRGFVSWDALIERANAQANDPLRTEGLEVPPFRRAIHAMRDANLPQLQDIVRAHPELLTPSEYEIATGSHLLAMAVMLERDVLLRAEYPDRMQPIMRWLTANGFDLQRELNICLCGHRDMTPEEVQHWVDRGADPNWVAPNGYSVLEHAVVRYFSATALDRLAQYATVRRPALWIAAGLGDVTGVASFLDRRGKPTAAARAHRPNFAAIGPDAATLLPGDDADEILMEAGMVAFMNGRTKVMEYLIERGFPIDTLRWNMPFVVMSVGDGQVEMVDTLVRCGADLDLRGAYNGSAREMARSMLESQPASDAYRRIAQLCGLDVDAVLAARETRPPVTPTFASQLERVLALATDDAHRCGSEVVTPEHVMFGMLRDGFPAVRAIVDHSGLDRDRFRADVAERVGHGMDTLVDSPLPYSTDVQIALDAAIALAMRNRRDRVYSQHLLVALLDVANNDVEATIVRYGGNVAGARDFLIGLC